MKRLEWTAWKLKEKEEKSTRYQRQFLKPKFDGYVPKSPYQNVFELSIQNVEVKEFGSMKIDMYLFISILK